MTELYSFTVGPNTWQVKAVNKLHAFGLANDFFRGSADMRYPGAWMQTQSSRAYKWVEGNFFD